MQVHVHGGIVDQLVPRDRSLSIRRSTTSPVRTRVATGFSTFFLGYSVLVLLSLAIGGGVVDH